MADVDILLSATDDASAAINKVNDAMGETQTESKGASLSFADMAGALTLVEKGLGYAKQAFDATIGATVAYADEVRGLQQVTGASAEETGRLIQVLDDYKVSSQQATEAQRYLTKQGIVLTTDALAKLSDEYLAQTSQADKNAFAQKNLGRNYKAFVEVLQQGSDAIRKQAAAVDESLVPTQKAIDQARQYQIALDNWNDSILALQVSIGTTLLPTVTNAMNATDDQRRAVEILTEANDRAGVASFAYGGALTATAQAALEQARAEREAETAMKGSSSAMDDAEQSALDYADAQKALEKAIQATTAANNGLLSLTMSIQGETDKYKSSMDDLNGKHSELQSELDKLTKQGWWPYSEKVLDATQKLKDNEQAISDLSATHEQAMKKIAYDLFVTKLQADGFTDSEYQMAIAAGVTAGVIDISTAKMALSMDAAATKAVEMGSAFYTAAEKARALAGEYVVSIRTIYSSEGQANYASGIPEGGGVMHGHASGGSFLIPQSYGNEGFKMGNGDTASAGERVTITPKGETGGGFDYDELTRSFVSALQKAGVIAR